MIFKWVDYCEKYEEETKTWTDHDTMYYALNESVKEDHGYYLGNSDRNDGLDYKLNETYFCKVVLDRDIIAAVLFIFRNDEFPHIITINPIIINPKHRNKGYCTKIIGELVNNISEIIDYDSNVFEAGFFPSNAASIKAFAKNGFVLYKTHPSGDFLDYRYTRK